MFDSPSHHDSVSTDPTVQEVKRYGDAILKGLPFREADHTQPIEFAFGRSAASLHWKTHSKPRYRLIAELCTHNEGEKDGSAFVLGRMVDGQRFKQSMIAMTGVGLDIDNGMQAAKIDEAVEKLGCLAVRYTTHSNMKTVTEFKKDTVLKFINDNGPGKKLEDDETIRWYLREKEQWDESVVKTAEYVGPDHTKRGIVICVKHKPMDKNRVIIFFKTPFVIAEAAEMQKDAMEKWKTIPLALAEKMGIPLDKSGTDPSRLFYFPRHGKGKAHETVLFGGPRFDWQSLELENPMAKLEAMVKGKGGKSKTPEGKELGRWSVKRAHGFQIVDVLEQYADDKIRTRSGDKVEIECPFDDEHSDAGNPEDRACFAVNAATGLSEIFTISCRHDSCNQYTNLDMVGRMIKEKWFGKEVLEDEDYNAILEEKVEVGKDFVMAIEALTVKSPLTEIDQVLSLLLKTKLSPLEFDDALGQIREKTKRKLGILKMQIATLQEARSHSDMGLKEVGGCFEYQYCDEWDFKDASTACIRVLNDANKKAGYPTFCNTGGSMARLVISADDASLNLLGYKTFWSDLCQNLTFRKHDKGGAHAREKVPNDLSDHAFVQAAKSLPEAPVIARAPVFLSDGTLLQAHGYHCDPKVGANHYLLTNTLGSLNVPTKPTREEAERALGWLDEELLGDFPFWDNTEEGEIAGGSRANALSMFLTPLTRSMIDGRTPIFLVNKSDGGAGGSLLNIACMLIADGEVCSSVRYSNNPEEMNKAIVTAALKNPSHLFFDDVKEFTSKEIHRQSTSNMVSGRILGGNSLFAIRNQFNWIANGVNAKTDQQMERRLVRVNLRPLDPNLHGRKYRHPHVSGLSFESFLRSNRVSALQALATLVRYWIAEGGEHFTQRSRAGYESWSRVVGGILESVGVAGFLSTSTRAAVSMEEMADLRMVQCLFEHHAEMVFSLDKAIDALSKLIEFFGQKPDEIPELVLAHLQRLDGRVWKLGRNMSPYMLMLKFNDGAICAHFSPIPESAL